MKSTAILLLSSYGLLFGSQSGSAEIIHDMTIFVFQLGIIIFSAKMAGMLFEKVKLPGTLGELMVGIVLGPYMLGSIPLDFIGMHEGLFQLHEGFIPLSNEIYGVSVIASIMLLFITGLETDIDLLVKYAVSGGIVGLGGVIFSFIPGAIVGMIAYDASFIDPRCLFLGAMSTATSVGISATILSKNKFMESPEGVTILSAAIIDDVLGIIVLAIVAGISAIQTIGGSIDWIGISVIITKAVLIWIGFTIAGLLFASRISSFLKKFKDRSSITVLALGMAFFLSGIFEQAGLTMIIGAYIMGLSLSKTDISYVIQETIRPLNAFFIPMFFTIMGMLVNIKLITLPVLTIGLIYTVTAMLGKVYGCGIPAMLTGFNKTGGMRIGFGMMPRGEVVLIIASVGLSNNYIDHEIYGIGILMVLVSILISPPLLNISLKSKKKGTKKDKEDPDTETFVFNLYTPEKTEFFVHSVVDHFDSEGYYISIIEAEDGEDEIYQIRKDKIFIKMFKHTDSISVVLKKQNMHFLKTLIYESFLKCQDNLDKIHKKTDLMEIKDILFEKTFIKENFDLSLLIDPDCVVFDLKSKTKEGVISELVEVLFEKGKINDKQLIYDEVLAREKIIGTGLKNGVAIPHARTRGVEHTEIAVGISKEGVHFESLDGEPSNIIILLVSSTKKDDPHLKVLAAISACLHEKNDAERLLTLNSKRDVWKFFKY